MSPVYLDYNASGLVRPEVQEIMVKALADNGNPSAVHAAGRRARARVETARAQVAELVGADPTAIVFSSGGTESNAQAILSALATGCERLIVGATEHPCVAEAAAELGSDFAVLVNNVASDDRHTLESVTPEYYDERMAINERPAFFAIQAVVPGMRRLGAGSVINLGSTGWQGKGTGYPCYAIAKSSVNGLTRGLAKTLGQDRIRINTVSPGWVMTERQIKLWLDAEGEKELARNQCLPDKLRPHDIARMVLFLASDDAAMCTAQEFKVDAGWV